MLRRAHIVALKARHQAFRIASEILYPHVEAPPPPQPVVPHILIDRAPAYRPAPTFREQLISGLYLSLVAVAIILGWVTLVLIWHIATS
jgi:hypothetical protein